MRGRIDRTDPERSGKGNSLSTIETPAISFYAYKFIRTWRGASLVAVWKPSKAIRTNRCPLSRRSDPFAFQFHVSRFLSWIRHPRDEIACPTAPRAFLIITYPRLSILENGVNFDRRLLRNVSDVIWWLIAKVEVATSRNNVIFCCPSTVNSRLIHWNCAAFYELEETKTETMNIK